MPTLKLFFAREYWLEIASIVIVGLASILFYLRIITTPILFIGMVFGLIPIAKTALVELWTKKKIGTELFITVAVVISVVGNEILAGAIVLMIILLAEYIASVSTERARSAIR